MTRKLSLAALLPTCFMLQLVHAQSTFGNLHGTTRDPSGLALDHAVVTVHSVEQNNDREIVSGDDGSFVIENLQPGHYQLTAAKEGLQNSTTKVELSARQSLRVDIILALASQSQTIEVSDAAEQVNTENAVIGDSKLSNQIAQLPLNFRAVTSSPLAALATSPNVQQDSQGNMALSRATANMVGYSVDGISTANVAMSVAGSNPIPPSKELRNSR
jgi:uncharacterized surface anchored protein